MQGGNQFIFFFLFTFFFKSNLKEEGRSRKGKMEKDCVYFYLFYLKISKTSPQNRVFPVFCFQFFLSNKCFNGFKIKNKKKKIKQAILIEIIMLTEVFRRLWGCEQCTLYKLLQSTEVSISS